MSSAFFLLGAASPVREKLRALYASSISYGEGSVNISNYNCAFLPLVLFIVVFLLLAGLFGFLYYKHFY